MPRQPRIDHPGAWHHVMHRGARRAPIFKKDAHCHLFLDLVENAVNDFELEIHAYSLMPNHYHLLVRSVHGNLSAAMRQLNATYTQRVNRLERWDGPVFRGRFRSQLVRDESSLPYLLAYIHLNPLKAGLITRLQTHAWTSHRAYLGRDSVPTWLSTDYFESIFDDQDSLHGYVLDLHRGKLTWPEKMAMDSGWLKQSGERAARVRAEGGESNLMNSELAMERICEITGVGPDGLKETRRGPRANAERRFAVWALRKGTLLTHREIGSLVGMSAGQVAQVLRRLKGGEEPFRGWISAW